MLYFIDPVHFPLYEGMKVEVEPSENVILMTVDLFIYYVKEHFKSLVLKNDILYCCKALYDLADFNEDFSKNISGEDKAAECVKQLITAELHQIYDDIVDLEKQLDEKIAEFSDVLLQLGFKIQPDIKKAVMTIDFDNESKKSEYQPVKVKTRPTTAYFMEKYISLQEVNCDKRPFEISIKCKVEHSVVILPETVGTKTVDQINNIETVTIEEPLQQLSPEKKIRAVKRKAAAFETTPPVKRQTVRPSKGEPQMCEVLSKPPAAPAPAAATTKRGRKRKATEVKKKPIPKPEQQPEIVPEDKLKTEPELKLESLPDLEPETIHTLESMKTQVGFLEYFQLCTSDTFKKMAVNLANPKKRLRRQKKHSEYVY